MNKTTDQLSEGDVVLNHGMRILLDGPAKVYPHGDRPEDQVYVWPGLVLNADELCDKDAETFNSYIYKHIRGIWWEDCLPRPRKDDWPVQGNSLARWVVEDPVPFRVVWEGCDSRDHNNPDAAWKRYERAYNTEAEAVHCWLTARGYENTRPVAVYPEPDWSNYTYDGKNPVTK